VGVGYAIANLGGGERAVSAPPSEPSVRASSEDERIRSQVAPTLGPDATLVPDEPELGAGEPG
jgi:hypothetical protein